MTLLTGGSAAHGAPQRMEHFANGMVCVAVARALKKHTVAARVAHVVHSRHGFSIETEYIIEVRSRPNNGGGSQEFETYSMRKRLKDFRAVVTLAKKSADVAIGHRIKLVMRDANEYKKLPEHSQNLVAFSELLANVVGTTESHPPKFHVRPHSKDRMKVVQEALTVMLSNFPGWDLDRPCVRLLADSITSFFLTDRIVDGSASTRTSSSTLCG